MDHIWVVFYIQKNKNKEPKTAPQQTESTLEGAFFLVSSGFSDLMPLEVFGPPPETRVAI